MAAPWTITEVPADRDAGNIAPAIRVISEPDGLAALDHIPVPIPDNHPGARDPKISRNDTAMC